MSETTNNIPAIRNANLIDEQGLKTFWNSVKSYIDENSLREGEGTKTTNKNEHAQGQYNVSNSGKTIHSVGIGTSTSDRKNAHEITNDGKHYILGVGGYDGTTLDGAQTLQDVINENADKIANIDTEALYYLLNPINLANNPSLPPNILEQNANEFDIKEKYLDTRYFVYKRLGHVYSVISIYYNSDSYEFTMAEGCPKQKYTWNPITGTLS